MNKISRGAVQMATVAEEFGSTVIRVLSQVPTLILEC